MIEGLRLFLDDVREMPEFYNFHAYSVNEAIAEISRVVASGGVFSHASLDHDLGDYYTDGGDGSKLTDWMAEHDSFPSVEIVFHSSNPVGVATMKRTVERYGSYSRASYRGFAK